MSNVTSDQFLINQSIARSIYRVIDQNARVSCRKENNHLYIDIFNYINILNSLAQAPDEVRLSIESAYISLFDFLEYSCNFLGRIKDEFFGLRQTPEIEYRVVEYTENLLRNFERQFGYSHIQLFKGIVELELFYNRVEVGDFWADERIFFPNNILFSR